jgi:hypothetical protein
MELKKALMVTEPMRFNTRSLYEMEGTNDGKLYSNDNSLIMCFVRVRPATDELLKSELAKLGIIIEDIPTIKKVAEKFPTELSGMENGKIASYFSYSCKNKFWEIVEIIKEEVR